MPGQWQEVLRRLPGAFLAGQAIDTESLDTTILEGVSQTSRSHLGDLRAMDLEEKPMGFIAFMLTPLRKRDTRLADELTLIRGGPRSRQARLINRKSMLGEKLKGHAYMHFMESVLAMLTGEGLIRPVGTWQDRPGWWLIPSAVRLCPGAALCYPEAAQSPYFHKLYTGIADDLASGKVALMGLEGREHTAQVRQEQREWREWRFRAVLADSRTLKGGGAASIATVGAAGLEVAQAVLAETQSAILPLVPYLETLRWVFIAVALIGVVVAIHARVDNWKMGQR